MKRRPLSLNQITNLNLSASAQLIVPESAMNELRPDLDISPATEIVEELIKTKAQVDNIIQCLLRSFDKNNHAQVSYDVNKSMAAIPGLAPVKRDCINSRSLGSRAHSWPPASLSLSYTNVETLYTQVENIAYRILQTSVIALLDTDNATILMKELQNQLEVQKNISGEHSEAYELLTKLLFIFAPLLRITESFVSVL